jgi:hypothetical protein
MTNYQKKYFKYKQKYINIIGGVIQSDGEPVITQAIDPVITPAIEPVITPAIDPVPAITQVPLPVHVITLEPKIYNISVLNKQKQGIKIGNIDNNNDKVNVIMNDDMNLHHNMHLFKKGNKLLFKFISCCNEIKYNRDGSAILTNFVLDITDDNNLRFKLTYHIIKIIKKQTCLCFYIIEKTGEESTRYLVYLSHKSTDTPHNIGEFIEIDCFSKFLSEPYNEYYKFKYGEFNINNFHINTE